MDEYFSVLGRQRDIGMLSVTRSKVALVALLLQHITRMSRSIQLADAVPDVCVTVCVSVWFHSASYGVALAVDPSSPSHHLLSTLLSHRQHWLTTAKQNPGP